MKTFETFAEVVRASKGISLPKFVKERSEAADINFGHDRNINKLKEKYEIIWAYTYEV